ncbi:MAG: methyltransferase MtaB domain-containing protein [Nitrososphaerota archaeon]
MRFKSLEMSADELVFGYSKHPLRYGTGLEVGVGKVIPEIKYFPRADKDLKDEYIKITEDVLKRALDLGVTDLQLETELTYIETKEPNLAGDIVNKQREIIEKYSKEHDLRIGFRVTVADIRDFAKPKNDEESLNKMLETFEEVSKNGADVLSIESLGGKELFNYAVIRQDLVGITASLGYLAILDMKKIWKEIVSIARTNNVIPGGDTACGFANTAMKLAGGFKDRVIPHTLAAIIRAMSASRSLVAYEMGAIGPGKDCGYENIIIKSITGYPISMEGKSSASAHSSLLGNISQAAADLWSNEQIENVKLFGGYGPQVFLEILYYDTKLLNKAIELGWQKELRDLLVESDIYSDPQAYVLAPKVAQEIAYELVSHEDELERTMAAGLKALNLIAKEDKLKLSPSETRILEMIRKSFENLLGNAHKKIEEALVSYEGRVEKLKVKDYLEV